MSFANQNRLTERTILNYTLYGVDFLPKILEGGLYAFAICGFSSSTHAMGTSHDLHINIGQPVDAGVKGTCDVVSPIT
jgi:hypothetical protein